MKTEDPGLYTADGVGVEMIRPGEPRMRRAPVPMSESVMVAVLRCAVRAVALRWRRPVVAD